MEIILISLKVMHLQLIVYFYFKNSCSLSMKQYETLVGGTSMSQPKDHKTDSARNNLNI